MEPKIPLPPRPSTTMILPPIHSPIDFITTDSTKPPQQNPPLPPATTKIPPSPSKTSPIAHHLIPPDEQSDGDDEVLNEKIPEEDKNKQWKKRTTF